jgi:hypothetical protein
MEPTGEKGGAADQSITWKDEIRDIVQRRNLKDECFDRELWREKIMSGLRKTVYPQKNSYLYN